MSEPLKACPFCGEAKDLVSAAHPLVDGWAVSCESCGASSFTVCTDDDEYDEREAIARWNRRVPPPVTKELLKLFVELVDHPRGSMIGVAKSTMRSVLAEWPEPAKEVDHA